jgi:hypothetical protein
MDGQTNMVKVMLAFSQVFVANVPKITNTVVLAILFLS